MTQNSAPASAAPSIRSASAPRPDRLLRLALALDAVVTGLNGVAYVAAAPLLAGVLGLPVGLLRSAGAFLLVYALAVWAVSIRPAIRAPAVRVVVALNAAWAAGTALAALAGWGTPTTAGTVWMLLQAAVVGAFAVLQWTGLRRLR